MTDDEDRFSRLLERLERHPRPVLRDLLDRERPLVVTRAPGRLDVMGGLAGHSGANVLEMPTLQGIYVAVQQSPVAGLRAASVELADAKRHRYAELTPRDLSTLLEATEDRYATARAFFRREEKNAWLAYVAGALLVLAQERAALLTEGLSIVVASDLPEGKGAGSSAALAVATLYALSELFGVVLNAEQLALGSRSVENLVVGSACGLMDPLAIAFGEKGSLVEVDCQRCRVLATRKIPDSLAFWGIDSGVPQAVKSSSNRAARVAAFMGYRIIADISGYAATPSERAGHVEIVDPDFGGFLANIDVYQFNRRFRENVPERMQGSTFLERYGGISDPFTDVDPTRSYRVRAATAHPVQEQQRVETFSKLIEGSGPGSAPLLTELMRQSQQSYSACGLGTEQADLLIELVEAAEGLHGAKITGAGGCGAVVVLGDRGADAQVRAVARDYESKVGKAAQVFRGSSAGACHFGARQGRYRLGSWWLD